MIAVQLSGTVSKQPETRQTQRGGQFAFTSVKVQHLDGDIYANVTAWDSALVDVLTTLKPGDPVTVCGAGKVSIYTGRDNEPRASLSVTASRIIALADTQAPPRAHAQGRRSPPLATPPASASFDFEPEQIPF